MEETKNINEVDNVEIEPLSDEDLESASGGCISNSCSDSSCSNGTLQPIDRTIDS